MSNELVPYSVPELKQIVEENYLPGLLWGEGAGIRDRHEQQRMLATLGAYLSLISIEKPVETPEEEAQQQNEIQMKAVNHIEQELWVWEYKRWSCGGLWTQQECIESADAAVRALHSYFNDNPTGSGETPILGE